MTGVFKVVYDKETQYYSQFGSEQPGYVKNKYLNPYYGYRYELEQPDLSLEVYRVAFTNGVDTIYPTANVTMITNPDKSSTIRFSSGSTYFLSLDAQSY